MGRGLPHEGVGGQFGGILQGYPGILPGYPGVSKKFEQKKTFGFNFRPLHWFSFSREGLRSSSPATGSFGSFGPKVQKRSRKWVPGARGRKSQKRVKLGGCFGYFLFFSARGGGKGGVRGATRGGGRFFIENPRRGMGFPGGGWGFQEGRLERIGEFGRGGLNIKKKQNP